MVKMSTYGTELDTTGNKCSMLILRSIKKSLLVQKQRRYEMQFTPTQEQQGIIECEALPYWNIN